MPSGTPGFFGSRLRSARLARSMTAVALAELAGVKPAAITQYETGGTSPRPEVLDLIARRLSVPFASFLRPLPEGEQGTIFFRSMSVATKTARLRAEQRLGWFQEIVGAVKEHLEFPTPNIPEPDIPSDLSMLTNEQIESAAIFCRREWGLGDYPLANVLSLLESEGVIVMRDHMDVETLDALSQWSSLHGCPYIVVGADKQLAARSRYDACHELGHLVLHRGVCTPILRNSVEFKRLEDQAHRFAGAFLLPAASFPDDVYLLGLDSFRTLKQKWMVSIAAMIKRLSDLEAMTEADAQRLWINYARRGWRHGEPGDNDLTIEEPRLVGLALETLRDEHDLPTFASQFPVFPEEAARMVNLPEQFFSGGARLMPFTPRPVTSATPVRSSLSAQIIRFPQAK